MKTLRVILTRKDSKRTALFCAFFTCVAGTFSITTYIVTGSFSDEMLIVWVVCFSPCTCRGVRCPLGGPVTLF